MSDEDSREAKKARVGSTTAEENNLSSVFSKEQAAQLAANFANFASKENHDKLKEDHGKLKEDHDKLKEDHGKLKGRLNRLVSAMEPATQYAKFETAVYEFVEPCIQPAWHSHADKIKYGVSTTCMAVLEALKNNNVTKQIQWHGPSTRAHVSFPKSDVFRLTEAGLKGMTLFIEQGEVDIINLCSTQRNKLVLDGKYLESMFGSPGDCDIKGDNYEASKAEIRSFQITIKRATSASTGPTVTSAHDFSSCIQKLVQALGRQGFPVETKTETDVVGKLNSMAGVSPAASTAPVPGTGTAAVPTTL